MGELTLEMVVSEKGQNRWGTGLSLAPKDLHTNAPLGRAINFWPPENCLWPPVIVHSLRKASTIKPGLSQWPGSTACLHGSGSSGTALRSTGTKSTAWKFLSPFGAGLAQSSQKGELLMGRRNQCPVTLEMPLERALWSQGAHSEICFCTHTQAFCSSDIRGMASVLSWIWEVEFCKGTPLAKLKVLQPLWNGKVLSDSLQPHGLSGQAPMSMEFSRQEYWSGLPFPSQGILQTQGLNARLLRGRKILYHLSHQKSPNILAQAPQEKTES